MKQKQSKIHFRLYTILVILCSISINITGFSQTMPEEEVCEPLSTHSKFICEMYDWKSLYDSHYYILDNEEISGIAYHPKSNSLFMPLDQAPDLSNLNNYIRGYDLTNETDFAAPILGYEYEKHASDFEGFTYIKDNYFILLEEQDNRLYFLEYLPKERQFNVLSGHDTEISSIIKPPTEQDPYPDKDGLEGLSYDPNTERLYILSEQEVNEGRLFSATLTLPGNGSLGEIHEISNTSLKHIVGSEVASLFHLGKIYPANSTKSNNILITSKFSSNMWEIGLTLDYENNLFECSATLISTFDIDSEPKPSGISVAGGKIYFANESLDGVLSSHTLKTENDRCDDNSTNIYDQDCACVEKPACEEVIQIPSNNILDVNYSSSQTINTQSDDENENPDVIIQQNEAVNLMSDHITLNKGFKVETGGCLNALIEPCD